MSFIIAIHPESWEPDGNSNRYAPYWIEYLERQGCQIKIVNAYSPDIVEQVRGCHGFMWRWAHGGHDAQTALRLIPVLENYLGIPCFPNLHTCWHYDDKAAQAYLFDAVGIPAPKTWFFTQESMARQWLECEAVFPLVLKLVSGAGSTNVILLHSRAEALAWLTPLFARGVTHLQTERSFLSRFKVGVKLFLQSLKSGWPDRSGGHPALHKGYALFQEFLPNNKFDTRVTVIGNRAFAYRRWNRENDFRASGSGNIDYTLDGIHPDFVRLAFDISRKLKLQSVAIDGLWQGAHPVVGEISYCYVHHLVHSCPGHWSLEASPYSGDLFWHEGNMWPATAMAEDFYTQVRSHYGEC